jgi:hypothetical protein
MCSPSALPADCLRQPAACIDDDWSQNALADRGRALQMLLERVWKLEAMLENVQQNAGSALAASGGASSLPPLPPGMGSSPQGSRAAQVGSAADGGPRMAGSGPAAGAQLLHGMGPGAHPGYPVAHSMDGGAQHAPSLAASPGGPSAASGGGPADSVGTGSVN